MFAEVAAVALVAVSLLLCVLAAHRAALIWRALSRGAIVTAPAPGARPFVTVQLPIYNEPEVVERLLDAAAELAWPRDRFEIQLLDDSSAGPAEVAERAVERIRAQGVAIEHVRRVDRAGFKAGALAHGLGLAKGDLVAIFDADFVPPREFLDAVYAYFEDPRVGLVQARWGHLNRAASWLTEAQALMLDGHFAIEQVGRAAAGEFFNFNGTAGVWRRAAIVEAGGWGADTLTEDLDLSYRAQLAGWRQVYLPTVHVPAELPETMSAFLGQQYRWAKGAIQCARKLLGRVARAPLSPRVKLEAFFHLTANFAYPATLACVLLAALCALGGTSPPRWLALPTAAAMGAYALYYLVAQARAEGVAPRPFLRGLIFLPLVVAVGFGISLNQTRAVFAGLVGPVGEFVRTPKTGGKVVRRVRGLAWPEMGLAAVCAVAALSALGGDWMLAPLLAMAAGGFALVARG